MFADCGMKTTHTVCFHLANNYKVSCVSDGKLDFDSFVSIASNFLEEEDDEAMQQELKEAFRLYDKEGMYQLVAISAMSHGHDTCTHTYYRNLKATQQLNPFQSVGRAHVRRSRHPIADARDRW